MGTEAWVELADAVAPAGPSTMEAVGAALSVLGLTPHQRSELGALGDRRSDPAGVMLRHLAESARDTRPAVPRGSAGPSATDRALRRAEELRALDGAALATAIDGMATDDLVPLPAAPAGDLVRHVVEQAEAASGADRDALSRAAVGLAPVLDPARLPIEMLARLASTAPDLAETVAVVMASAPPDRVVRGLADAVRSGVDPAAVAEVLEVVARVREAQDFVTSAPPPLRVSTPPPTASPPGPPVPPPATGGDEPVVTRGGGPSSSAGRPAYPRLDLTTDTGRSDVVVVDRPFTVTVGLAQRPSSGVVRTGPMRVMGPVDVVLVYDPASLVPSGPTRHTLSVTADEPFPTVDVTFTAQWLEKRPRRRIGVQYLADGQVVGIAWRSFDAVDDPASVPMAAMFTPPSSELLDLSPLLGLEPPDLVLGVVHSERGADTYVWTAFSADPTLPIPDAPDASSIGPDTKDFALDVKRTIQFSTDPLADYLDLAGRSRLMGAAVPEGVKAAVKALVEQPGRTTAPTVLLLTEELVVPWEIASLGLQTPWGGSSPFLGAHVAISRWPLDEHGPRPVPAPAVRVEHAAVVTADYTGVAGVSVLEAATAEAGRVAALFTPPASAVQPTLGTVIGLLSGSPPADVVHVALHGQFDAAGSQGGIVLVKRDGTTTPTKQFLTPLHVENGRLDRAPFVFLNACQVGADKKVLGAYGGFASTLLRIGASSVVAPLWNIDDDVASLVADELYARAYTAAEPEPVAEVVRAIRARYTREAVEAATPGVTATLVAFQLFGHPRLRLSRGR
ncbi:MAG TPA: CHAT domain-containing protein [Ornithinibacter sp.]|nr:CHAT domain-containing protein [Ornithinibacter sp.]